ncbi:hypothetical protein GCM10009087_39880 [Sphingomonas oligophenolica]|uniref:Uncharacterized protein n=1 Tax=Sphingomonas oligophenolica TaxID=301154 RepID=A0ABU9Y285_9SPHN
MKSLVAAAALLFVPAAAMAQATPAQAPAAAPAAAADPIANIYDKALGAGWENMSSAKTELSADIGSAHMPIRVEAQGYQALYLHHAPFSAAPYRGISMLIQAVGGEAEVRVVGIVNGKPIPNGARVGADGQPEPRMKVVKVVPGGWTKVQIPFDQLGIGEGTTIDGFWVQNNKSEPAPHLYVADIMLDR